MNVSLEEMKAKVEEFIYQKTNKKINIIFDNPMVFNRHFKILNEMYSVVLYNESKNK